MSQFDLFSLYLQLIVIDTIINIENKRGKVTEQKSDEFDSEFKKKTFGPEIDIFLDIRLLQEICKLPKTENYWNPQEDIRINQSVNNAMFFYHGKKSKDIGRFLIKDLKKIQKSQLVYKSRIYLQRFSLS